MPPYIWMPPLCLDAPHVWTPFICLDAPHMFEQTGICLGDVWMPPCTYTTHRKHAMSH